MLDLNYLLTRFLHYSLLKLTIIILLLKIKSCTNFQDRNVTRTLNHLPTRSLNASKPQPFNPPLKDQKQASHLSKAFYHRVPQVSSVVQPGIQTYTLTTSPLKPDKSPSSESILQKNQYSG